MAVAVDMFFSCVAAAPYLDWSDTDTVALGLHLKVVK